MVNGCYYGYDKYCCCGCCCCDNYKFCWYFVVILIGAVAVKLIIIGIFVVAVFTASYRGLQVTKLLWLLALLLLGGHDSK